jgi:hypothetical protein
MAIDSIGNAHGTLMDGASLEDGALTLTLGAYVELPSDLLENLASVTVESWFVRRESNPWQRVFDFGDNDGSRGTSFVFLSPQAYGSVHVALRLSDGVSV